MIIRRNEVGSIRAQLAWVKLLTNADGSHIRSVAGRVRPAYADFSLCCNDKATGPSSYVFCVKEFVCPSDQILPAG